MLKTIMSMIVFLIEMIIQTHQHTFINKFSHLLGKYILQNS